LTLIRPENTGRVETYPLQIKKSNIKFRCLKNYITHIKYVTQLSQQRK